MCTAKQTETSQSKRDAAATTDDDNADANGWRLRQKPLPFVWQTADCCAPSQAQTTTFSFVSGLGAVVDMNPEYYTGVHRTKCSGVSHRR